MKKQYTVNELANLSGVSVRTLHYYDQIGLLCPTRVTQNQYRSYNSNDVNQLQQILFYRKLGIPLKKIKCIMDAPDYDKTQALEMQLEELLQEKCQLELLINNVIKTLRSLKGELEMTDMEKFEGFKQRLLANNEKVYGKEIRENFGDTLINASNERFQSMDKNQFESAQDLSLQINETLKKAFEQGNPAGELAQNACDLHRQWLCMFWKDGTYSKEAHKVLAEGYVKDPRFTAYYDKLGKGCTKFFRDAINIYCEKSIE